MAKILAVGIATLDIVNVVEQYPREDDEIRALSQHVTRGGNATNTLAVLSQLGHRCHWAGVLADERDSLPIQADLERHNIETGAVRRLAVGKVPTSYITLSKATGTRTIVHYRDLPEYRIDDFRQLSLEGFDWLHFEGRAVTDTQAMLAHARDKHPGIIRSVEIEKPREGIEALFADADILLFSRHYAQHRGFSHPPEFLSSMRPQAPHAELVCSWGEQGAWALNHQGELSHSPAFPPAQVVDTLGAGDTFNAGFIDASLRGLPPERRLAHACRLAGRKCGQLGLSGLYEGETA